MSTPNGTPGEPYTDEEWAEIDQQAREWREYSDNHGRHLDDYYLQCPTEDIHAAHEWSGGEHWCEGEQ